jgi:hypothetical protein
MSRTVYLDVEEGKVVAHCLQEKVGVSAIERLPAGGVRLVCMSSDGAARIRAAFKKQLLAEESATRDRHRPNTPLW